MKTVVHIAHRFVAGIANFRHPIVTGDATMNALTNKTNPKPLFRMARCATALLAFAGLLAMGGHAAKADVVVDKFVGPQDVYNNADTNLTPGMTALQLKVHNTSNYAVSGVSVKANIYFASDVHSGWHLRAAPSKLVSLAANQSKWINLIIPDKSLQGQDFHGRYLYAQAVVSTHTYWLNNFLDAAYNISAQETRRVLNSNGSVTFALTYTNICHVSSPKMTVTVNYAPYADGDLGPKQPLSSTLPLLLPGHSATLTYTTRSLSSYSYAYIDSDILIGTDQLLAGFRL